MAARSGRQQRAARRQCRPIHPQHGAVSRRAEPVCLCAAGAGEEYRSKRVADGWPDVREAAKVNGGAVPATKSSKRRLQRIVFQMLSGKMDNSSR